MNRSHPHLLAFCFALLSGIAFAQAATEPPVPATKPHWCKVHQVRLRGGRVPVDYGMPRFPPGYLEAAKRDFPNANQQEFGGCDMPRFHLFRETVLAEYCPLCRTAEEAWQKNHAEPARQEK